MLLNDTIYINRKTVPLSNNNPINRLTEVSAKPLFCTIVIAEVKTLPVIKPPNKVKTDIKSPKIRLVLTCGLNVNVPMIVFNDEKVTLLLRIGSLKYWFM